MYEELVEALRLCAKYGKAEDALANAQQAADAIEELQRKMQTQIALTKFFRDKTFELENRFEDYRMKSRARGKWELFKCRDAWRHYQCSVCGKIVHNDIYDKTDCRSNYCPDCGANMEVDGE